ncbi:MAG: DNA-methyltransferase, partial [Brevundimonas sp.]
LLASAEVPDAGEQQDDAADDADGVPEAPATPVSRVGDVWAIGAHRLICGDAADADVVATLMAGEQAALCFTSPPYGNQRDYTTGGIADWDALMRGRDGEVGGWTHAGQPTQDMRIPDSVIRVMRHKGKIGEGIDHPAVFPVALPEFVIDAYTDAGDIVFEPFGGSGTTMLAAERTGRLCRSVEIAPEYVDVAIKRFQQIYPGVRVTLIATDQSF